MAAGPELLSLLQLGDGAVGPLTPTVDSHGAHLHSFCSGPIFVAKLTKQSDAETIAHS